MSQHFSSENCDFDENPIIILSYCAVLQITCISACKPSSLQMKRSVNSVTAWIRTLWQTQSLVLWATLNQMFRPESEQKLTQNKTPNHAHCRCRDLISNFCDLFLFYKVNYWYRHKLRIQGLPVNGDI